MDFYPKCCNFTVLFNGFVEGVKNILPPKAAEYFFSADIFFLILLCKIRKKMSAPKYNFA